MKIPHRGRLLAGLAVELLGAALIASSLGESGGTLTLGVAIVVAGALVIFTTLLRGTDSPESEPAAQSAETPGGAAPGWRPETELSGPIPRTVRLSAMGQLAVGVWVLAAAAAVAFFELSPAAPTEQQQIIQQTGERVLAAVEEKESREYAGGRILYLLRYEFRTADGQIIRSSATAPKTRFDSIAVGDPLTVFYLAEDPLVHYVDGLAGRRFSRQTMLAAAVLFVAGFLLADGQRRRHKRLTRDGIAAPGSVDNVRRRGGARAFEVRYEADGKSHLLETSERNRSRRSGDVVTVLYKKGKPARAILYRQSLYRARAAQAER